MNTQYSDVRIDTLMSLLHTGADNALSRETLAAAMDMPDRTVRKLVEKARDEGCFILNNQNGRGYYLPETMDDVYRQYKQDTSRAMSILKRRKHMRRALKEVGFKV